MNRFTFGLITFFLTFGLSFSLVGLLFGFPEVNFRSASSYSNSTVATKSITRVLDQDMRNGDIRRPAESKFSALSDPDDAAQAAYLKDVMVYANASSAIDVSGTPADFQYAWNQHMQAWTNNSAEINPTWRQVLRIADRYNVPMKRRYFR